MIAVTGLGTTGTIAILGDEFGLKEMSLGVVGTAGIGAGAGAGFIVAGNVCLYHLSTLSLSHQPGILPGTYVPCSNTIFPSLFLQIMPSSMYCLTSMHATMK